MALLDCTKYSLIVTLVKRQYGGPPPKEVYDGPEPGQGCQVYIGSIPRNLYEDKIVPLLEQVGTIWEFTLMIDRLTGQNKGYGYANFTTKEAAKECIKKFHRYEIRPSKFLTMFEPKTHTRLYVKPLPTSKTKEDILAEFDKISPGLKEVDLNVRAKIKTNNRGCCFLEYYDHTSASQAHRKLSAPDMNVFDTEIFAEWHNTIEKPVDQGIIRKVKVLFVHNVSETATEEIIRAKFSEFGEVEKVTKNKDYAFVYFKEIKGAKTARKKMGGQEFEGKRISISLARPPNVKSKKQRLKEAGKKEREENRKEKEMLKSQRGGSGMRGRGMVRGRGVVRRGYGDHHYLEEEYYPEKNTEYGYEPSDQYDGLAPPFNPYGTFPPRRPRPPPRLQTPRLPIPMMEGFGGNRVAAPRLPIARGFSTPPALEFRGRARPLRGKRGYAVKRKEDFASSHGGKRGNVAGGGK